MGGAECPVRVLRVVPALSNVTVPAASVTVRLNGVRPTTTVAELFDVVRNVSVRGPASGVFAGPASFADPASIG